jgi:hypothetical protein
VPAGNSRRTAVTTRSTYGRVKRGTNIASSARCRAACRSCWSCASASRSSNGRTCARISSVVSKKRTPNSATATLAAIDAPLRAFYAALDDEQKARLLRDLTLSRSQAREGDRAAERFERRSRWQGISGAHDGEANAWAGICESLTAALRAWPIHEIERRVGLSQPQRVAFYELVTSSLKVADTLASACPAETALTPPARLALLRARLAAVRQATVAIRPALTQFYEALNQGQKI